MPCAAWLLAAALLAMGAPASSSPRESPGTELTLEALLQGMAKTAGFAARFREVKEISLLSAPLEVRGTLHFVPPNRLARTTTAPSRSWLVIDGDRMLFRDEAGGEDVDLGGNPVAREFVANMIVIFAGDATALRERYEPDFRVGEGRRWTLRLTPRRRPLADVIARLTVLGEGAVVTRMELLETSGDRTTTWLEDVEVDRRFTPEGLERIFAPPGAATDAR